MGKGDDRRPRDESVSRKQFEQNWDMAFNPPPGVALPIATSGAAPPQREKVDRRHSCPA